MVFSSLTFLFGFLPIVLLLYYGAPRKMKNLILMLSGLFFYAWGEPFYVILMIFTVLADYSAGLLMERWQNRPRRRMAVMLAAVILNLGLLGVFKYGSFVVENINALTGLQLFDPELPLPIGISFYTFQALSYVIDLYRRNIKVQRNVINFTAYVTMFPQLIMGPIVLYSDVEDEINERPLELGKLADGISLFICGFAKKMLLANSIGVVWSTVKAMDYAVLPAATAWIGILAFTFQLYFDFSGYSDMAVGMGRMLGFEFPRNFNLPYLSKSISEFWRRWHMTLSHWFKSYVYIPLGGNRKGLPRTVVNLLIVWLLTGLWHGASWNFVLWGLYFGVLIILEKLFLGKLLLKLPGIVQWLYSFLMVVLGWVLFEMNSLSQIAGYFMALFGANGAGFADRQTVYLLLSNLVMFLICAVACTNLLGRVTKLFESKVPGVFQFTKTVFGIVVFLICICYTATSGYNPFLYSQF